MEQNGADPRGDLLRFYSAHFRPGIVDLSSSSPPAHDIETPVEEAVADCDLEYVAPRGAEGLREAVAARYEGLGAEHVVITAGASEALAAVALALVEAGDTVAVDRATYPSFTEAARTAGGRLTSLDALRPGVSVAVACNPTAPDGRLMAIEAFARRCEEAGAVPICDEVYRDLVHDGTRLPSVAEVAPRGIGVGGLSKALGLGGLRIGWAVTRDTDLLAHLDRQLQLLSGGPAALSVAAAEAAFASFDDAVQATLSAVREQGPGVYRALREAGWRCTPAVAGITVEAWPPGRVSREAEARLHEEGFFLVPCDVYGTPGTYRVSLLADVAALRRALAILAEGLEARGAA